MASRTIPSRTYTPGTRSVEVANVPANSAGGRVIMTRESWPEDALVTVTVWFSRDNGETWQQHCSAEFPGGDIIKRDGSILEASSLECEWPGEFQGQARVALVSTDIRVIFENNITIMTAVTLESF